MTWWVWILLGLALLAAEVAVPGGVIMVFFGVAALIVGTLKAAGLIGPMWLEWLLFSVLSVVSLLTLRGPILRRIGTDAGGDSQVDSVTGEAAVIMEDVPPGGTGKAEFRGTSWSARNVGNVALAKGQRCVVDKVERLTIFVRAS